MAYGHILGKNILEVPPLGIYNFHASMLPKYRGASPIETAIACGETETGVSLMRIVEEMDAGAVADVERVPIGCDDTYRQISEKISGACPVMLGRNLDALCSGTLHLSEQSHANATFTRKLSKSDGLLDFSLPAEALKNRIRALTPHIGCVLEYDGISLKIGAASAHSNRCEDFRSGQIVAVESDAISVATADGLLLIGELQRPGGRMLKIKDFINGFPIEPGKILPSHPSRELVSVSPFNKFHK
jgi:methionyl-tRNA formyltransferase